jgi:hypothetical protein
MDKNHEEEGEIKKNSIDENNNADNLNNSSINDTPNHQDLLPSEKILQQLDNFYRGLKEKRIKDAENIDEYREKLMNWAVEASNGICNNTSLVTKPKADTVNKKVEEVWASVQRVQKLETELIEIKNKIKSFYHLANLTKLPEIN